MFAELAMPFPIIDFGMQRSWPVIAIAIATVVAIGVVSWQFSRALRAFVSDAAALVIAQIVCGLTLSTFAVTLSPDTYAYAIYGRLVGVYGLNPYALPQPPLRLGGDALLRDALSVWGNPPPSDNYGPAWTILAAALGRATAAYSLGVTIVGQRLLALAACVATTLALVRAAVRKPGADGARGVAGFALSPLVLLESIVNGHNDIIMVAPAVWAFVVLDDAPLVAALLCGTSVAIKYVSIAFAPYLLARTWKRHGPRTSILAALVAGCAIVLPFVPFWRGPVVFRSIVEHGSLVQFSPAALAGAFLAPWLPPPSIGMHRVDWNHAIEALLVCVLALTIVAGVRRFARDGIADPAPLWRTLVALIAATPALGPHLLVWAAPMCAARGGWGLYARVLGVCALSYYVARALPFQLDAGLFFAAIVIVVPLLAVRVRAASGTPHVRDT